MTRASRFITLTTDFGLADGFVGTMKGVIYTINPDAIVTDISHEISPQDISEAALVLEASFRYFPRGTVHLAVVDPGVGSQRRAIAVKTEKYYFVAPDNGLLTRALAWENVLKRVELTNPVYFLDKISNTFHGRDIFAPVAAHLSLGVPIENLGIATGDLIKIPFPQPEANSSGITGHIIHIDGFGNLMTDIPRELFEKVVSGRHFIINFADISLDKINSSYADAPAGQPLAIFNSFDNLEIGTNLASAAEVLKAQKGDKIRIAVIREP